jgi:hypothetical protein
MSIYAVEQYIRETEKLIRHGGSSNEGTLAQAFTNLLNKRHSRESYLGYQQEHGEAAFRQIRNYASGAKPRHGTRAHISEGSLEIRDTLSDSRQELCGKTRYRREQRETSNLH